jgi:hypothetical protein
MQRMGIETDKFGDVTGTVSGLAQFLISSHIRTRIATDS